MKNSIGQNITLTVFGESHGGAIGCVLDGLAPGVLVDEKNISDYLTRRRPSGLTDTKRHEPDNFRIVSGVFDGKTTGTPVCILIPNEDTRSKDYEYGPARPSHADYAAFCKYHGFEDYRGGGHFSGRVTAAIVAAGGIIAPALERLGIHTATHILSCGGFKDNDFSGDIEETESLKQKHFPVLSDEIGQKMTEKIEAAGLSGDSIGGVVETEILGLPAGLGEPMFDSIESLISHAMFSIGAVKGVEFGLGFKGAELFGSEFNDAFRKDGDRIITSTNNNGGVNGGITNGMPVVFRCAVKPTPSISRAQKTVDFVNNTETDLVIKGRHDPAIVRRICPVIESMTAVVIADILSGRYGTDVLARGIK